ncbi:MAG: RIP metalloprotease RseP [Alphaproteobacteria bacterium]|nr:RIP metalloprotease RseP [Alphaproteobacteria bacterium]
MHHGLNYILPFVFVLTVLVFVHEFGHFFVARRNGVRVDVFSIGFGPELFGWYDRAGTRWKFSAIPLGGYVKMFGDSDASSGLPGAGLVAMTPAERDQSFHHKRLGQRTAIVAAGPAANFLFAVAVLALLFMTFGQPFTPAQVGQVQPGSAAGQAGIKRGDVIVSINGSAVHSFEDVQQNVRLNPGVTMTIVVKRDGRDISVEATPKRSQLTDRFGNRYEIGLLGIAHKGIDYVRRDPATAVIQAGEQTWDLSVSTLKAMWQIAIGVRGTDELGGPLRIAQMSGDVAQGGVVAIVWFMAVLSINLGLINLFPIPVLDGGHLLFYAAEALRGKPLGQRAQEYGFRIGLALVLTLMVFATWNDLVHLRIVEFVRGLVT